MNPRRRKYWYLCIPVTIVIVIVVVVLALFVAFPAIAQNTINGSSINIQNADITFGSTGSVSKRDVTDGNSTFNLDMKSSLSNTGPFSATITFDTIDVYYNDTILLGSMNLPTAHVSGGHGELDANTVFTVANQTDFGNFAKDMLAVDSFKWTLKGGASISALSRTAHVNLNKEITLFGMGGFPNVTITSFNLPYNDPAGGIHMTLGTVLVNPSPIGVQLGTIHMSVGYQGVYLGDVTATNVTLVNGPNTLNFEGRMVPLTNPNDLAIVSVLFSNYLAGIPSNTTATGVSAAPDGVHAVSWLSQGLESVQLDVSLAPNSALQIITGVTMGDLDLVFTNATAYSPATSAPNVTANFVMPFGFSINITEVTQNITLGTPTTGPIANLNSGYVQSTSNQTTGTLAFALNQAPLMVIPGMETAFNDFNANLTRLGLFNFTIAGNATIGAQTPIGTVRLSNIPFNTTTSLNGLQNLNTTSTIINSIDVTGGTTDGLQLAISVGMENPSNLQIATGDVTFLMNAGDTQVGTVTLPNLNLTRGPNTVMAVGAFNPAGSDAGQQLLTTFIEGKQNTVGINGYNGTTIVASLQEGLEGIILSSIMPGLNATIVQGASLSILDDTLTTGYATTFVTIANPFTAGMSITHVISAVTYSGMPVGNIDSDLGSNPIVAGGHSSATSGGIPLKMNLEPAAVALLLRANAVSAGIDVQPLDALLTMGGFDIPGQQQVSASAEVFNGFNVVDFVTKALANLHVDLQLVSTVVIGQYTDDLSFVQNNIACKTDSTVSKLIPIVGQPIVQSIVNSAVLSFDSIILSSPTNSNFQVQMNGKLTGTGPFSATISFPTPLSVAWEGRTLGTVSMSNIQTQPDTGATFSVTGTFSITDNGAMGDFAAYMLNNNDFSWEITGNSVSVTALGYTFTGLSMVKDVSLTGMQSFKDDVTITAFNLPANDPNGGIVLDVTTAIKNPSTVGVDLSGIAFESYLGSVDLGPLSSVGGANFPPNGQSSVNLTGSLQSQSSSQGLSAIQTLFTNFLSGKATSLTVKGKSASGPSGQVDWLTRAFESLTIDNVELPGSSGNLSLIPAITLKDLSLDFTKGAYSPLSSSNDIEATLQSPFGFPLDVTSLSQTLAVKVGGMTIANLNIPENPATTTGTTVKTGYTDVTFAVPSDAHDVFNQFTKALTLTGNNTFELSGVVNAHTGTNAGAIQLGSIPFDVQTSLMGMYTSCVVTINSISIIGATANYVDTKLSVTLNSPSPITISVGDVTLRVIYNGYDIGPAIIKDLVVKNGANTYDADFQLTPTADTQQQVVLASVLSGYLMHQTFQMQVTGTSESTSVDSLKDGFAGISLATSLTGIEPTLIVGAAIYTLDGCGETVCMGTTFTLQNSIDTDFAIESLQAAVYFMSADLNITTPTQIGSVQYTFDPVLSIPARGQVTSTQVPIAFDLDAMDLLGPLVNLLTAPPFGFYVNVAQTAVITVGSGGPFHGALQYSQNNVWTSSIPLAQSIGIDTSGYGTLPNVTTPNVLSANASSSVVSSSIPVSTASAPISTASTPVSTTTSSVVDTTSDTTTATPAVTTTDTTTTTDSNTPTTTTDLSTPTSTTDDATVTD
ncbi:hypothetical protein K450DRAFT_288548 [Umbelopsis ramanniana AG]|uniref:Uncharacterized protein n=1 Tax=Umbelopsis ramanniana AG TaxID=1314678 RepID=A0AAD5E8M4_UMBRA|nr:uncharacterized protein K450DRAFT_288548 [Umbelopsis ramanniana AG]KAI8579351.1 hypothetical protein K450DRAFT_288548 [Umbelopsis ramanniana AG]